MIGKGKGRGKGNGAYQRDRRRIPPEKLRILSRIRGSITQDSLRSAMIDMTVTGYDVFDLKDDPDYSFMWTAIKGQVSNMGVPLSRGLKDKILDSISSSGRSSTPPLISVENSNDPVMISLLQDFKNLGVQQGKDDDSASLFAGTRALDKLLEVELADIDMLTSSTPDSFPDGKHLSLLEVSENTKVVKSRAVTDSLHYVRTTSSEAAYKSRMIQMLKLSELFYYDWDLEIPPVQVIEVDMSQSRTGKLLLPCYLNRPEIDCKVNVTVLSADLLSAVFKCSARNMTLFYGDLMPNLADSIVYYHELCAAAMPFLNQHLSEMTGSVVELCLKSTHNCLDKMLYRGKSLEDVVRCRLDPKIFKQLFDMTKEKCCKDLNKLGQLVLKLSFQTLAYTGSDESHKKYCPITVEIQCSQDSVVDSKAHMLYEIERLECGVLKK